MVSRRFACLLLAASMTLSSIWIVSADQSHQIQDAAAAAATYSAAVQVLEGAGLSQSAEANAGIAIDMGLLDREETLDLSQLSVQAVQLQQEEKARQEEAVRPLWTRRTAPAVRPPARPCWTPMTAPWPPAR